MATGNGSQVRDIRQKTNAEIMPTVVLSCSCNGCRTNAPASEKSTVKPTCIILSSDTENEEPSVSKTFTSTGLPSWRRKINGEYEIGEVIGVGGFGTVYAGKFQNLYKYNRPTKLYKCCRMGLSHIRLEHAYRCGTVFLTTCPS